MGKRIIVLHAGREKRTYCAHLELAKLTRNADSTICGWCALIRTLPPAERELWDSAKIREFSVGVQAGTKPNSQWFVVKAETVKLAAELNAQISFTVYAPQQNPPDRFGLLAAASYPKKIEL